MILLSTKIDAKSERISLVYGGQEITGAEIKALRNKFKQYDLENDSLEIRQGFAYVVSARKLSNSMLAVVV